VGPAPERLVVFSKRVDTPETQAKVGAELKKNTE